MHRAFPDDNTSPVSPVDEPEAAGDLASGTEDISQTARVFQRVSHSDVPTHTLSTLTHYVVSLCCCDPLVTTRGNKS